MSRRGARYQRPAPTRVVRVANTNHLLPDECDDAIRALGSLTWTLGKRDRDAERIEVQRIAQAIKDRVLARKAVAPS